MLRPRFLVVSLSLLIAVAGIAGCTRKNEPSAQLPAADGLLKGAAADMKKINTVHFAIDAEGTIAGLALRGADGDLTRIGDAHGTAQLEQSGQVVELEFIVKGDSMYIKGPTGGFQQVPLALAASVYDPSAILDPDRGVAQILETATGGKTQSRESVNGIDAYRVTAKLDPRAVSTVVPGVTGDIDGELWIAATQPRLLKTKFAVPGQGGTPGGTVTITLSNFDLPVTVTAP
ncbi:MAG TPA: LppX_LprAFG lipoprotein [Micromonosporaceae bacterium]|nr:LppX_LprAFG lipoprotein [Micromonosporaceae bacterium]